MCVLRCHACCVRPPWQCADPLASTTTTAGAEVAVPYLVKHVYVRCLLLCYAHCVPVERERERKVLIELPCFFPLSRACIIYETLFFFVLLTSCLDSVINSTTGASCRAVENTLGAGSPVVLVHVLLVAARVKRPLAELLLQLSTSRKKKLVLFVSVPVENSVGNCRRFWKHARLSLWKAANCCFVCSSSWRSAK